METPNILIVDDSSFIRKIVIDIVTKKKYKFSEAENGVEAMRILSREKFDAMITDLDMPGMNGIELVVHCKERYESLPVMVMTASAAIGAYKQELMSKGVREILSKPFDAEKLGDALDNMPGK